MPTTTLRITSTVQITPLLNIRHEDVRQSYREGMSESIRHSREPIPLTYLLTCLKQAINVQVFDGKHQEAARDFVGFHLGCIHGAVLTAKGTLRPNVATLTLLESKDAIRGYWVGRQWWFEEAEPHEQCGRITTWSSGSTNWPLTLLSGATLKKYGSIRSPV